MNEHIDEALDVRAVGGENYGMAKTMMEKLDQLIGASEKAFNDRVQNAATPFAVGAEDDEEKLCFGLAEKDVEFTVVEENELREQALVAATKEKNRKHLERRKKNQILVGYHKGVLTPFLPGYK